MLLDRLPRGHVVAVDSSASMVEHAREALDPERATVFQADLTELELDEPVDAVFSNAVFHWIPDHDRSSSASTPPCGREGGSSPSAAGRETSSAFTGRDELAAEEPYAEHLSGWERALELRRRGGDAPSGSSGPASRRSDSLDPIRSRRRTRRRS